MRPILLLLLAASCATVPTSTPATPTPGGGIAFKSADGRTEIGLEGLFQTVVGVYDEDRVPSSDVMLKRMRPELAGRIDDALLFKLETKFSGSSDFELEEAWIGTELGSDARLMLGRMKAPFGLEEVRSRRYIDFPNFSILTQFAPAEDHGIFINGRDGIFEYGVAAYNGTGASDTNGSKDVAARVMAHPFDDSSMLENMGVGVAATVGRQSASVAGDTIDNAMGLPVIMFAPGTMLDGDRRRLGFEFQWHDGPYFVQSEYMTLDQDMTGGEVGFSGAYLNVSTVLTGEDKDYSGVTPRSPFSFKDGTGEGAWIAALRISHLEIDDAVAGLAVPGTFTDSIDSISLGLNWVPNNHAIVRHSLVRSSYDDSVSLGSGSSDGETALLIEFQLHF
jgi:phosphate-selective porin